MSEITVLFFSAASCAYCPGAKDMVRTTCATRGYTFQIRKRDDADPERNRIANEQAERYGAGSLPAVAILVDGKHVRTYCGSTCGVNLAAWRPGE